MDRRSIQERKDGVSRYAGHITIQTSSQWSVLTTYRTGLSVRSTSDYGGFNTGLQHVGRFRCVHRVPVKVFWMRLRCDTAAVCTNRVTR